jgi:hypothetical protein
MRRDISAELRKLIGEMSRANHLSGAPHIHGELLNLIRDPDTAYGPLCVRRLRAMGIRNKPITLRSPWQNPTVAERVENSRPDREYAPTRAMPADDCLRPEDCNRRIEGNQR